jgi:hypothetical protein
MVSPVSESDFTTTTDGIFEDAEKIRDYINKCVDAFNDRSAWGGFTIWITGKLDQVLEALNDLVEKFGVFAEALLKLSSPGNPVSMYTKADDWREVQSKLSGQIGELASSRFPATYSWEGRDGWAYAGIVSDQSAAVSGAYPHADALASHLEAHAKNVIDGWSDIALAVGGIYLDVVRDASQFISADPLKWLDIVPTIVTLVADLIENVANGFDQLEEYATTAYAGMQELAGELASVPGSRSGAWPTADFA